MWLFPLRDRLYRAALFTLAFCIALAGMPARAEVSQVRISHG